MRWLITGAGGLLGHHVLERLAAGRPDDSVVGLDRARLDITVPRSVRDALAEHRPDVVVNCAGYTAVDAAEAHEPEALRVNGAGPRHLAAACAERRARLIHVSTDQVFSGEARTPYAEDHPPAPRTAYGRTKLAGERAVLAVLPRSSAVVRTAWLHGARGRSFVRTMIELEARRDTVDVVDDQLGQPTWAADVAERIVLLGRRPEATGVFHATNSGAVTRYELAREIFRLIGADPGRVRPTTSEAFAAPARRPPYAVLAHGRWREIGAAPLRDWRTALREALARHSLRA
ncbi:dTDP-4-dehydrorhamnose reductase [Streptosporangium fragile]|uniref:dTDP-4-dehydrorhamnose reductase n=1 Tax=Streptosporangium fragile TaxID=46186 RepID=A0ABN3W8G8_9ACTN